MADYKREKIDVVLSYSHEAELMLIAMGIDKAEFEKKFFSNIEIGSRTIMEYGLIKTKEKIKQEADNNGK